MRKHGTKRTEDETWIAVTRHAEDRMHQRSGLKKKSLQRLADRAYDRGTPRAELKSEIRHWVDHRYETHDQNTDLRVYGDKLYVFCEHRMVTLIQLPVSCTEKRSRKRDTSRRISRVEACLNLIC